MSKLLEHENQFEIRQGESTILSIQVLNSKTAKKENIEGATAYFTVKKTIEDETALIQKISTDPAQILFITPREGLFEVYLLHLDTITLDPMDYIFDCWLILASGEYKPIIQESIMVVKKSITRFIQ